MLSDFDLIGTINDDADVPEDEESGSDDEVSKHHRVQTSSRQILCLFRGTS